MSGLVKNEFIKLFSRKKTYIIILLFVALSAMFIFIKESEEKNFLQYSNPEFQLQQGKESLVYYEQNILEIKNNTELTDAQKTVRLGEIELSLAEQKSYVAQLEEAVANQKDFDWRIDVRNQIRSMENMRDMENQDTSSKAYFSTEISRLQAYLDHDIDPRETSMNNGFQYLLFNLAFLASGFLAFGVVLFNADAVSGEYNPGTMKFLLIQPVTRIKVLLSKFIVMAVSSVALILGTQVLMTGIVGLWKGMGNPNVPMAYGQRFEIIMERGQEALREIPNTLTYIPLSDYLVRAVLLQALFIVTILAFVFMVSTISKSSVISMTIGIGTVLGSTILFALSGTLKKMGHLFFINYSNVEGILSGSAIREFMNPSFTLQNAVIVLTASTIAFLLISLTVFKKRDVLI
jgi:ABC-2 type transport system permease protein